MLSPYDGVQYGAEVHLAHPLVVEAVAYRRDR